MSDYRKANRQIETILHIVLKFQFDYTCFQTGETNAGVCVGYTFNPFVSGH